jgi:hypothetical protein
MTESAESGRIPLTLYLSASLAQRLKMAAETQKRPAAELVVELLDRHLPRPQTGGPKKGSIPYS